MSRVQSSGYWIPPPADGPWLRDHVNFISRSMILEICVRLSLRVPGNIIEFGVATGDSTRVIKRTLARYGKPWVAPYPKKIIFALDSFEGLQERYENAPAGTFAGAVPRIRGVNFEKGYFEKTCTEDLAKRVGRVAFAHLDADLHSSTLCALNWLTQLLGSGSLLLFDEYVGEDLSECRAFDEWRSKTGTSVLRLAEFDRDPSGYGTGPDRRLLYQVVGDALTPRDPPGSLPWTICYYLRRFGLHDVANRVENRY